jgi:putative intracellular protease/amidase
VNLPGLTEEDIDRYDVIFIAGGHGVLEDLANSQDMGRILRLFLNNNRQIITAVCHGPAAFKSLGNDKVLEGIKMTGFSKEEEESAGLMGKIPFELEPMLKSMGADYSQAEKLFSPYVVTGMTGDGRVKFITGENPASSKLLAETIVEYLKKSK